MNRLRACASSTIALLVLGASLSCSPSSPVPDLPTLRRQVDKGDPEVISTISASKAVRAQVQNVHPGALFYLAEGAARQGMMTEARALYRAQLDDGDRSWAWPALRGWIRASLDAGEWQAVLDEGLALAARIDEVPAGGGAVDWSADPLAAAERERALDELAAARCEAASRLDRWDQVRTIARDWRESRPAEAASQPIGESPVGAWLPWQSARSALRAAGGVWPPDAAAEADILRYALGSDARSGHGDIEWLLGQAREKAPGTPKPDADWQAVEVLLVAKDRLARDRPVQAWELFQRFLPRDSLSKAERAAARDRLDRLAALHAEAGIPPLMFLRDLYNAARLAGRLSDGVKALDLCRERFAQAPAGVRVPAVTAYACELAARLAKAAGQDSDARKRFREALRLARAAEAAGALAPVDRRRMQWYLLGALAGSSDDIGKPGFDLAAFLAEAVSCDDPDYFADVLETAVLRLGSRADWKGLARLRSELDAVLPVLLKGRCDLLLARSRQLADPAGAAADPEFNARCAALRAEGQSLYYRLVAAWMQGEPSQLEAELARGSGPARYAAAAAAQAAQTSWGARVADGYWDTGLADACMEFAWARRASLDPAWFATLGRRFVEAGRYRQGLKLLDSLRVRFGHPAGRELLSAFYPQAYLEGMRTALAAPEAAGVPEWLMYAMVRTESNFDSGAQSGPGARGLAQLMPATAAMVAQRLKIESPDLTDPNLNLRLGSAYLADQMRTFGQWTDALAAYNAGGGRIRSWRKAGMPTDPILFAELIPFEETRNYVRRIVEGSCVYAWLYAGIEPGSALSILYTPGPSFRQ